MRKDTNTLVFATNNRHKLEEIRAIAAANYPIVSLEEAGFAGDIPETAETIEGNAIMKARFVYKTLSINCFADDTGLEVEALNGAPGVYSARYAGEGASYQNNVDKLLDALKDHKNRSARFKTVIALIINGSEHLFEGVINGKIISEPRGLRGFGYDPVFVPDGYDQSFAELSAGEKNAISHRAIATNKLIGFLKNGLG